MLVLVDSTRIVPCIIIVLCANVTRVMKGIRSLDAAKVGKFNEVVEDDNL